MGDPQSPRKMLFLHGLGTPLLSWRKLLPRLSDLADCVAPDMLGMGRGRIRSDSGATLYAQAATVPAILDALHWDQAILVGHSWGGSVAAAAAVAYPERVAGLVLLSGAVHPQRMPLSFWLMHFPGSPFVVSLVCRIATWMGLSVLVSDLMQYDVPTAHAGLELAQRLPVARSVVDAARDLLGSRHYYLYERFHLIRQPTLAIHAEADRMVPLSSMEAFCRAVPQTELVLVSGRNHMVHFVHLDAVAATMRGFLQRHWPD